MSKTSSHGGEDERFERVFGIEDDDGLRGAEECTELVEHVDSEREMDDHLPVDEERALLLAEYIIASVGVGDLYTAIDHEEGEPASAKLVAFQVLQLPRKDRLVPTLEKRPRGVCDLVVQPLEVWGNCSVGAAHKNVYRLEEALVVDMVKMISSIQHG